MEAKAHLFINFKQEKSLQRGIYSTSTSQRIKKRETQQVSLTNSKLLVPDASVPGRSLATPNTTYPCKL